MSRGLRDICIDHDNLSHRGNQPHGRRPRVLKSKTAGLCEEPGRCEFVLADS